jgi:Na+/H+ antiporter NhaC
MYAPFAFFNILCPIIAVIYGYSQIALQGHRPAVEEQG